MKRYFAVFTIFILLSGCGAPSQKKSSTGKDEIIIFAAGSLAVPMQKMEKAFEAAHPDIDVKTEFSGSRTAARKVSELKKECDIVVSSDYTVIDEILIPDHATWNIRFATNELAIGYTAGSRHAGEINRHNWKDLLLKDDVHYGRSDPATDPCGYRTILTLQLAEKYYEQPGLAEKILQKDRKYIRPKETDLLALLETGTLDYIFIYKSVILQHGLKLLSLPDSINLGFPSLKDFYAQATVAIPGKKPGETIIKKGEPIVYGVTMVKNAPHKENAISFLQFMLGEKGRIILDANGQTPAIPSPTPSFDAIPDILKPFARPE